MAKPSDNSLGAPTEGLGQNVTFAYANGSGVPQLELGDPGRIRAGVIGGGTVGAGGTKAQGVAAMPKDDTLELLLRLGGDVIKPFVDKRKTEAYVSGMHRAMQGEAVTDIANSRPWYSKLFGETDVIEGARAYTGNTKAQTLANAMEDQMPELRKMDGVTAQQYYIKAVEGAKTGDTATDLAVMQSLTRTMPGVMRRQAKEHYAWKQEQATAAEDSSFKATADGLQASGNPLSKGFVSAEDFKERQLQFVRAQVPAMGRDEENWKAAQTARYIAAARGGKFHAVNAGYMPLAEGAPSAIEALDEKQQTAIASAVEYGQSLMRNKYSDEWSPDLAKIQYDATLPPEGDTPQALAERIDAINTKYSAETGSKTGLISPREKVALMTRSGSEIAQERAKQAHESAAEAKRLAAAGDKVKAADQVRGTYAAAFDGAGNLTLGDLVKQPNYSMEQADAVAYPAMAAMPVEQRIEKMRKLSNSGFVSPRLKQDLSGKVQGAMQSAADGGYTPSVQAVFDDYLRAYRVDPTLARQHYDGEGNLGTRLMGWAAAVENGADRVDAFNQHMRGPQKRAKLDAKETAAVVKQVTGQFNGWTHLWMGDNALKPGQAEELTRTIAADVADTSAALGGSIEQAVQTTMKMAVTNKKLEVIGGYVTGREKNQASLSDYLTGVVPGLVREPSTQNVGSDKVHEEFSDAIEAIMRGNKPLGVKGVTDEDNPIRVIRYADTKGVPTYKAMMLVDGDAREAIFTADEIPRWAATQRKWRESAHGLKPVLPKVKDTPSPLAPRGSRP